MLFGHKLTTASLSTVCGHIFLCCSVLTTFVCFCFNELFEMKKLLLHASTQMNWIEMPYFRDKVLVCIHTHTWGNQKLKTVETVATIKAVCHWQRRFDKQTVTSVSAIKMLYFKSYLFGCITKTEELQYFTIMSCVLHTFAHGRVTQHWTVNTIICWLSGVV